MINKNLFKSVFAVAFCSLILYSCNKESRWDCIKRTGKAATEVRNLPPFNKIYLEDNVDAVIIQGAAYEARVACGKNLISLIKTEVDSGVLHLKNENRCNWARSYKKGTITVFITLPTLRNIWHFGSGFMNNQGLLVCDTLDIWAHQTGNVELTVNSNVMYTNSHTTADITLHGSSDLMGVWHTGEGYLRCSDFITNHTWTNSKSSGDEYLNPQISLSATINWEGNIYYNGNPSIALYGTGKGKLIKNN